MEHLNNFVTFSHYCFSKPDPQGKNDLAPLLIAVSEACKEISKDVNKGHLAGILGSECSINVQGEEQKKLDVISNDILLKTLQNKGRLSGMASEEMEDIYPIPEGLQRGDYLLLFDPLDGSSNIDVNISVGTIFSILKAPSGDRSNITASDFLQPGVEQVAAGYCLYGSSTMMVLSTGDQVDGFTLHPSVGDFILTHPNIKIPEDTGEFSINTSNKPYWEAPVKQYIGDCLEGKEGPRAKSFNMRWVGSMVADVHRTLMRGGIFMYPLDTKNPDKPAKLRLMYEANPMSFLVEKAGGLATTGYERILEIDPEHIHQRVPVILGSKNEVATVLGYHKR